jgi:hypothetical protein
MITSNFIHYELILQNNEISFLDNEFSDDF